MTVFVGIDVIAVGFVVGHRGLALRVEMFHGEGSSFVVAETQGQRDVALGGHGAEFGALFDECAPFFVKCGGSVV